MFWIIFQKIDYIRIILTKHVLVLNKNLSFHARRIERVDRAYGGRDPAIHSALPQPNEYASIIGPLDPLGLHANSQKNGTQLFIFLADRYHANAVVTINIHDARDLLAVRRDRCVIDSR